MGKAMKKKSLPSATFLLLVVAACALCSAHGSPLDQYQEQQQQHQQQQQQLPNRGAATENSFPAERQARNADAENSRMVFPEESNPTDDDTQRERRSYFEGTVVAQDLSYYRRPAYFARPPTVPFYIPIYGNPRRFPVYFPIKPILFNPGYPTVNRPRPPVTEPSVDTPNRFGEDDKPVWDTVDVPVEPPSSGSFGRPSTTTVRPSRRPPPPLLHKPSQELPSTSRPANIERTTRPPPPTTTASSQFLQSVQGPSRCTWAIISCCNPAVPRVRYECFEQLGCPGAFWGVNPCSSEVLESAVNFAAEFYNQAEEV